MSDTYTKLFRSIAASTIVSEPLPTRWLWVTLLSQADRGGNVYGSVPGLARLANITLAETEAALVALMSPDPYSRTPDHEGRRLEAFEGGWRLLNHAKYAAMRNEAERAEYKRNWDRENRPSGHKRQSDKSPTVRQKSDHEQGVSDTSPSRSDKSDRPDPTNTSTNTNTKEKRARPATASRTYLAWLKSLPDGEPPLPDDDPVFGYAAKVGLPLDFVALAWAWFEATYGPDGSRGGKRYADWRKVFRNAVEGNWAKAWYADGDGYRLTTVGLQLQRAQREAA